MTGNGVPGAVGQGRVALLPGHQVPGINRRDRSASVSAVGRRANFRAVPLDV